MRRDQFSIRTRDGTCPAHVFTPEGSGPWPAAIFYMDGLGIRPTLFEMALADQAGPSCGRVLPCSVRTDCKDVDTDALMTAYLRRLRRARRCRGVGDDN
jgi:hypothetical protein